MRVDGKILILETCSTNTLKVIHRFSWKYRIISQLFNKIIVGEIGRHHMFCITTRLQHDYPITFPRKTRKNVEWDYEIKCICFVTPVFYAFLTNFTLVFDCSFPPATTCLRYSIIGILYANECSTRNLLHSSDDPGRSRLLYYIFYGTRLLYGIRNLVLECL